MQKLDDQLSPKGRVEIFTSRGAPVLRLGRRVARQGVPAWLAEKLPPVYASADLDFDKTTVLSQETYQNIVVSRGRDKVIDAMIDGFVNVIARISIGDRGTIPADQTVPKVPTVDRTTLFNEVFRDDIDATVRDTGAGNHEVKFIKTFSSVLIPITAFSNQAKPVVNEVGLVTADLLSSQALPRGPVSAPDAPLEDEQLFAMRCFKSVPFESANEIAITIRYTIYIEH